MSVSTLLLLVTNYFGYAFYLWNSQTLYLAAGAPVSTLRLGHDYGHYRTLHRAPITG